MKKLTPFSPSFDELPATLPVFPLSGAVLLPRGHLPLNIFEPRYLKMVDDSLSNSRLIGMIQPASEANPPELCSIGCAGRITRYEETSDGRMEILLSGICRFEITSELDNLQAYRLVQANWAPFEQDMSTSEMPPPEQTMAFKGALRNYMQDAQIEFELDIIDKLELEDLVNSLVSFLPLDNVSKQILLEADSLPNRVKTLMAILQAGDLSEVRH